MFIFVPQQSKRSKPGRGKNWSGVRLISDISSSLPQHGRCPGSKGLSQDRGCLWVSWQILWFPDITPFFRCGDKGSLKKKTNKDVYYSPAVVARVETTPMPHTRRLIN